MEVRVDIAATPGEVWRHLADLRSHAEWMSDAGQVFFEGAQTSGVGTRMTVPTRLGPFRTTDEMTVTGWEDGRLIAAQHHGVVSGQGSLLIEPQGDRCSLVWREELRFPWWMGGAIGHFIAAPILRRVWSRNLERFKGIVETSLR